LRLHLELERERQRDAGVPQADALRAARRRLGNGTLIRERTRDVWGWRWLDELGRDVRHAVRGLRRSPGFTATVVVVLALGIGANTAMFAVVYGVLLRPLPYPDAGAIVRVGESLGSSGVSDMWLSNRSMPLLVESAESFEQLAAYQDHSVESASLDGAALSGARVSPSLFPLLRAAPHLGRLFTEEEARVGANPVVLLSHGAWTRRFASDPDVVGTLVDLDGDPHAVVGVLAEDFYFPSPNSEFWTPYVIPPFVPPNMEGPAEQRVLLSAVFRGLGRLRPGVSPTQAATETRTILQRSSDDFMGRVRENRPAADVPEVGVRVVPLLEEMVGEYRPALLVLAAATALVLLIACINVAGLLLARGVTRRRTLAVCAALGAGRSRLARQLLTESMALSLGGGVLGLAVGAFVLRAAPALVPVEVARLDEVGVDAVVLVFTVGLSIAVGLLFGAAPVLQWSRVRLVPGSNEGGAQSAGGFRLLRSNRARAALATAQVALTLVLLIGAGLLLRSFVQLVTFDRGYDPINAVTTAVTNPVSSQPPTTPEAFLELRASHHRLQVQLLDEMTTRLEPLPDIEAFGLSWSLPLEWVTGSASPFRPAGTPMPSSPEEFVQSRLQVTSPGYFEAMGFRLRAGRTFTRLDGPESPRVLVANETLARGLFGGEPAVGRRVLIADRDEPWEVIGVVEDIVYEGLELTAEPRAEAFFSMAQTGGGRYFGFRTRIYATIRTAGDPLAAIPFLREAATAANPQATLGPVMTMEARLSDAVAQPRFYAVFVGSFAGLALLLVALGIYGLLSYTVAQRRGEIGIRMALGARRGDILALVFRQGAAVVVAGGVIGVFAAAASARVLESLLYGVDTDDPLTFIAAPLVVVAVALVACWFPARRAARVDPMKTLRFE
ncbi:MAG: ABC transporter permease, partial [Acidobacteria bacterium]|nr:ABC transporter permease [Acidobacteriota bacterium]